MQKRIRELESLWLRTKPGEPPNCYWLLDIGYYIYLLSQMDRAKEFIKAVTTKRRLMRDGLEDSFKTMAPAVVGGYREPVTRRKLTDTAEGRKVESMK